MARTSTALSSEASKDNKVTEQQPHLSGSCKIEDTESSGGEDSNSNHSPHNSSTTSNDDIQDNPVSRQKALYIERMSNDVASNRSPPSAATELRRQTFGASSGAGERTLPKPPTAGGSMSSSPRYHVKHFPPSVLPAGSSPTYAARRAAKQQLAGGKSSVLSPTLQQPGSSANQNGTKGGEHPAGIDLGPVEPGQVIAGMLKHHQQYLPFQTLVREQAKSMVAIKELQYEVSSLLVLKDALLETFPHLHHRISALPHQDARRGVKPGLSSHQQPSPDNDVHHLSEHSNTYSSPSSWWTNSRKGLRKSPDSAVASSNTHHNHSGVTTAPTTHNGGGNSSAVADSGFSTEASHSGGSAARTINSSNSSSVQPHQQQYLPPDVRWDAWTAAASSTGGGLRGASHSPSSAVDNSAEEEGGGMLDGGESGVGADEGDELMSLLEVIHRKAVKLRNQNIQDTELVNRANALLLGRESEAGSGRKTSVGGSGQLGAIAENGEMSAHGGVKLEPDATDADDPPIGHPGSRRGSMGGGTASSRRGSIQSNMISIEATGDDLKAVDREALVDRISQLESETVRSRSRVAQLEADVAAVSRQRDQLRLQLLKTGVGMGQTDAEVPNGADPSHPAPYMRSSLSVGSGGSAGRRSATTSAVSAEQAQAASEGGEGQASNSGLGIIHSVHILTMGDESRGSSGATSSGSVSSPLASSTSSGLRRGVASSANNLLRSQERRASPGGGETSANTSVVNIEIRQQQQQNLERSTIIAQAASTGQKSGDYLGRVSGGASGSYQPQLRQQQASGTGSPSQGNSVSVVNLRSAASSLATGLNSTLGTSNDRLYPVAELETDEARSGGHPPPPSSAKFFQNRIVGLPTTTGSGRLLVTGPTRGGTVARLMPNQQQYNRLNKSRSVENLLYEQMQHQNQPYNNHPVYGQHPASSSRHPSARMRNSNSEVSLLSSSSTLAGGGIMGRGLSQSQWSVSAYPPVTSNRMKGTKSEQVLNKIGKLEKVKLSDSVMSMPAELLEGGGASPTGGVGLRVKPNRERIRQVLGTNSVLELQRQLLTTVMENEVYKSQLIRVSDSWNEKIREFEKVNSDLESSLSKLRAENDQLRVQMDEKAIELEGTRARLRQLEGPEASSSMATPTTPSTPTSTTSVHVYRKNPGLVGSTPPSYSSSSSFRTKTLGGVSGLLSSSASGSPLRAMASSSEPDLVLATTSSSSTAATSTTTSGQLRSDHQQTPSAAPRGVTFDLSQLNSRSASPAPSKDGGAGRFARFSTATRAVSSSTSQLPSDARQRLQEMAGLSGSGAQLAGRNYQRRGSAVNHHAEPTLFLTRPNRLNLITNGLGGSAGKYIVTPVTAAVSSSATGGAVKSGNTVAAGGYVAVPQQQHHQSSVIAGSNGGQKSASDSTSSSTYYNHYHTPSARKLSGTSATSAYHLNGGIGRRDSINRAAGGSHNNNNVIKQLTSQSTATTTSSATNCSASTAAPSGTLAAAIHNAGQSHQNANNNNNNVYSTSPQGVHQGGGRKFSGNGSLSASLNNNMNNSNGNSIGGGNGRTRTPSIEGSAAKEEQLIVKEASKDQLADTQQSTVSGYPDPPDAATPSRPSSTMTAPALGSPAISGHGSGRQLPVPPPLQMSRMTPSVGGNRIIEVDLGDAAGIGGQFTSLEIKRMERDTIADLIAGILQKCSKRDEIDEGRSSSSLRSQPADGEKGSNDDLDDGEQVSRPVTVLQRKLPTQQQASRSSIPSSPRQKLQDHNRLSANQRTGQFAAVNKQHPTSRASIVSKSASSPSSAASAKKRLLILPLPDGESWDCHQEAFKHTEEMMHRSHTTRQQQFVDVPLHCADDDGDDNCDSLSEGNNTAGNNQANYLSVQAEPELPDSLNRIAPFIVAPDSLNNFEGEEYEEEGAGCSYGPQNYHDDDSLDGVTAVPVNRIVRMNANILKKPATEEEEIIDEADSNIDSLQLEADLKAERLKLAAQQRATYLSPVADKPQNNILAASASSPDSLNEVDLAIEHADGENTGLAGVLYYDSITSVNFDDVRGQQQPMNVMAVSRTPTRSSKTPTSARGLDNSRQILTPTSSSLMHNGVVVNRPASVAPSSKNANNNPADKQRRRMIIPYCDNSLSSGNTSNFTSSHDDEDFEFEYEEDDHSSGGDKKEVIVSSQPRKPAASSQKTTNNVLMSQDEGKKQNHHVELSLSPLRNTLAENRRPSPYYSPPAPLIGRSPQAPTNRSQPDVSGGGLAASPPQPMPRKTLAPTSNPAASPDNNLRGDVDSGRLSPGSASASNMTPNPNTKDVPASQTMLLPAHFGEDGARPLTDPKPPATPSLARQTTEKLKWKFFNW